MTLIYILKSHYEWPHEDNYNDIYVDIDEIGTFSTIEKAQEYAEKWLAEFATDDEDNPVSYEWTEEGRCAIVENDGYGLLEVSIYSSIIDPEYYPIWSKNAQATQQPQES